MADVKTYKVNQGSSAWVSPRPRVPASPRLPISPSPRPRVTASPRLPISPSPRPRVPASPRPRVIASPCRPVTASPCLPVPASPRPRVTASPRLPISPSPRPRVSVSPRPRVTASPRPPVTASPCLPVPASPRLRVPASPCLRVTLLLAIALLAAGCRLDMQDQPKMKPLRATTFFRDGISSRPPVAGTVPRGFLHADKEFYTGKKSTASTATSGQAAAATVPAGANAPQGAAAYPDDVELFPLPVTDELVKRGQERYEIFCSVCHGLTGNGDGMIVRRGFRRAASFHADNLRQAPVGHYFDAITNGWGAMPSYAVQVPVHDRWAIIAYIRALQLSRPGIPAGQSQPPSDQQQATPTHTPTPTAGGHN